MMTKPNLRLSRLATRTFLACALLAAAAPALAHPDGRLSAGSAGDGRCSDQTLRGDYAFTIEGVFVDAPVALPLRGVALTRFDGRGKLTQVDHVVFNGMPPPVDWTPATGTYSLKADCTGEALITIPGSPFSPVTLRLVVAANGTQIRTVVSKAGYVVTSTATKVDLSR